jgi:hypothetical protein
MDIMHINMSQVPLGTMNHSKTGPLDRLTMEEGP